MACLLSPVEVEALEDVAPPPPAVVGAFARDRAAADRSETDVLPKAALFGE